MRLVLSAAVLFASVALGAPPAPAKPAPAPVKASPEVVKRGEYLVTAGGCNHCHTPWSFNQELQMPMPDMSRMLSGHPKGGPEPEGTVGKTDIGLIGPSFTSFKLPFGLVYAANLTPDVGTGMGGWTEKMFVDAMRTGKSKGGNGRAILPPMPWPDLGHLTDADLSAMFAYLQSIPAIKNEVPAPKVPQPVIDGITKSTEKLVKMMKAGPPGPPAGK